MNSWIGCLECGVVVAYHTHQPDGPELAGRIEMLLEQLTKPKLHLVRHDTARKVKKTKRPKREDAAQSAFRLMQHVIEQTEGQTSKPAKHKVRKAR